jgi:hypothetical protein
MGTKTHADADERNNAKMKSGGGIMGMEMVEVIKGITQ